MKKDLEKVYLFKVFNLVFPVKYCSLLSRQEYD